MAVILLTALLVGCQATGPLSTGGAATREEEDDRVGHFPEKLLGARVRGIYDDPVRLTDGRFAGEPFAPGGASRPTVSLLSDPAVAADLNGDGKVDWIVVLAESSGGSGTFTYLAVMQGSAQGFQNTATQLLGDRVSVENIAVRGRLLTVDVSKGLAGDPACCPSGRARLLWQFINGDLVAANRHLGHLTIGHEVREFSACSGNNAVWVVDDTSGDLADSYARLSNEIYQPLFVEVVGSLQPPAATGFGADYPRALRVARLLRMQSEGFGCELDLAAFGYRASGVEPFWQVDVMARSMELRRPGLAPLRVELLEQGVVSSTRAEPAPGHDAAGSTLQRRFLGRSAEAGEVALELWEQRCVDTMSGGLFPYRAELRVAAETFSGCAFAGQALVRQRPSAVTD